eukprot:1092310-Amorphochlora_amoeboformis.AAC.2
MYRWTMQASNVNPLATHEFSFSLTVAEEYAFDTKSMWGQNCPFMRGSSLLCTCAAPRHQEEA